MSTKFFNWDGGAAAAVAGLVYKEAAPVEFQIQSGPIVAIQGWHGITADQQTTIVTRLLAAGWIEGAQSKSDVV